MHRIVVSDLYSLRVCCIFFLLFFFSETGIEKSRSLVQGVALLFNGVNILRKRHVPTQTDDMKSLQLGLGLGGPIGGIITDMCVKHMSDFADVS
jgi:hypothetical protein